MSQDPLSKLDDLVRATDKPEKPIELESDETNGDKRTIKKVVKDYIRTKAQLIKACEIDESEWRIDRWKCGAWQTAMKDKNFKPFYTQQFIVMAWMSLKHNVIHAKNEIEELRKKAIGYAPVYVKINPPSHNSEEILCEMSISDHHFGALAWSQETGGSNWDLKKSKESYEKAVLDLIAGTKGYGAGRGLIVLGNDQQNFDNRSLTTTKGTPQSSDGRYQKVFSVSKNVSIWTIEQMIAAFGYVDVIVVSGNHDAVAAWHLGDTIDSWFRNCVQVTVDNRPLFRKYYQWGTNMLMFTHGNAGKLEKYPEVMAAEQPQMWGATKWRESHTGDKHHRRLIELRGASVRIMPSLRPPDAWSSENQYIGSIRAAEALIWHRKQGLIGTAIHSIL